MKSRPPALFVGVALAAGAAVYLAWQVHVRRSRRLQKKADASSAPVAGSGPQPLSSATAESGLTVSPFDAARQVVERSSLDAVSTDEV
jgi:hypothetical protein